MVAVAIQPNTSAMRAQRRAFVLAILLKKVFTDKDFIMIVLQTFLGFQQRTGDYNLVEQVPLATNRAMFLRLYLQGFPTRDYETRPSHPVFCILACAQCSRFSSHGIVVHITHDYQLQFLVRIQH